MVRSVARAVFRVGGGNQIDEGIFPDLNPSYQVVVASGPQGSLDPAALKMQYAPGDRGELQQVLAGISWNDTPGEERVILRQDGTWASRDQLQAEAVILNFELLKAGAQPWPELNGQIVDLDWANRRMTFRFIEPAVATTSRAYPNDVVTGAYRSFWDAFTDVLIKVVQTGLIVVIGAAIAELWASGGSLLIKLAGTALGILVASSLDPTGIIWKAIKWVVQKAADVGGQVAADVANKLAEIANDAAKNAATGFAKQINLGGIAVLLGGGVLAYMVLAKKGPFRSRL